MCLFPVAIGGYWAYGQMATMPSSEKHPSTVPMWKGVKVLHTNRNVFVPNCNRRILGLQSNAKNFFFFHENKHYFNQGQ
ncbi:hypothetical protein Hdeb2414_s0021g00578941 [Helianthus debilis subsp. tardiflorus]